LEVPFWWVFGVVCVAVGFYALVVWMQWPSSSGTPGVDDRRVDPWMQEWKPLVVGLSAILIGVLVLLRIIRIDGP
jgi:hypothetical protein